MVNSGVIRSNNGVILFNSELNVVNDLFAFNRLIVSKHVKAVNNVKAVNGAVAVKANSINGDVNGSNNTIRINNANFNGAVTYRIGDI